MSMTIIDSLENFFGIPLQSIDYQALRSLSKKQEEKLKEHILSFYETAPELSKKSQYCPHIETLKLNSFAGDPYFSPLDEQSKALRKYLLYYENVVLDDLILSVYNYEEPPSAGTLIHYIAWYKQNEEFIRKNIVQLIPSYRYSKNIDSEVNELACDLINISDIFNNILAEMEERKCGPMLNDMGEFSTLYEILDCQKKPRPDAGKEDFKDEYRKAYSEQKERLVVYASAKELFYTLIFQKYFGADILLTANASYIVYKHFMTYDGQKHFSSARNETDKFKAAHLGLIDIPDMSNIKDKDFIALRENSEGFHSWRNTVASIFNRFEEDDFWSEDLSDDFLKNAYHDMCERAREINEELVASQSLLPYLRSFAFKFAIGTIPSSAVLYNNIENLITAIKIATGVSCLELLRDILSNKKIIAKNKILLNHYSLFVPNVEEY